MNTNETTSFHVSNYGRFGGNLPRDLDGYCHLTAAEWLNAPMDAMSPLTEEQAEEMAEEAIEAKAAADAALAEWRSK